MLNISKQQALQRWEVLPDSLREALFSDYNADTLWRICGEQHLPEERISKVAALLGDVILGFAHFDDLAKDISLEINISQELANSIVKEIDRKILLPIKADIERNYKPLAPEPLMPQRRPEAISEIKKPVPSAPQPASTPSKPPVPPIRPSVSPQPPVPPKPPMPPLGGEGPLVIHKETEFKPLSDNKKSLGGLFNFLNKGSKKETISPIKTKIEIGPETFGAKKEEKKEPLKTPDEKVRVVHYSDVKTPTPSPFGGGGQSLRDLSQPVRPPAPKSSMSPSPVVAPKESVQESKKEPGDELEKNVIDLRSFK